QLTKSPPYSADHVPQNGDLVLRYGDFIHHDLFLVHAPLSALPAALACRMDREATESVEQFSLQIENHLGGYGLPVVVREREVETTGGKSHSPMIPAQMPISNASGDTTQVPATLAERGAAGTLLTIDNLAGLDRKGGHHGLQADRGASLRQ